MTDGTPQSRPTGFVAGILGLLRGSRSGVWDTAVSLVPQGVRVVTGLATSILLARGLGPAGLGQYALCMSLAELTGQLSDVGLGQTGARFAARAAALGKRDLQMAVLRWAFRVRLLVAVLMTVLAFLLVPALVRTLWDAEHLTSVFRLALPVGVFAALASVPVTYFQSIRRFGWNAAVSTGQSLVSLGGVLVLAALGSWTVRSVVVVTLIATAVGALVFLVSIPREALVSGAGWSRLRTEGLGAFWRPPVVESGGDVHTESPKRFAFFMYLASLINLATGRIDLWLIGAFLKAGDVGVFSAAGRLSLPLVLLLGALNAALWPRAAGAKSAAESGALARRTFKASSLVAGAAIVYGVFAPLLAPVLFGSAYRESVLTAQVLCVGHALAILTAPVAIIGYNYGLVRVYWLTNLLQLATVVVLLVVLLPRLGALAAGIAFVAHTSVGGLVNGYLVWDRVRSRRPHGA